MSVKSYRSEKVRVTVSPIHGRGLTAVKKIPKNEIIAIKNGHIIDGETYKKKKKMIGEAECQIADNFFLAPLTKKEYSDVMIYLNHSCDPNVGFMGNIVLVAIKDIPKNAELTLDYAFYKDEEDFRFTCSCGVKSCRKVVTGKDWQRKEIQRKYKSYFSSYLQRKIEQIH